MTTANGHGDAAVGFHSGELAVQGKAGVRGQAGRLAGMVGRGQLRAGTAELLASAQVAVVTARDHAGRLWTSPLFGDPGFLTADGPTTLQIGSRLPAADPLHGLPDHQLAGAIVIDFATRRRWRINGVLSAAPAGRLEIEVDQSYGNCPKYIHTSNSPSSSGANREPVYTGSVLRAEDRRMIQRADTFFLGTSHPQSGADASHRGGPPGFVLTAHDRLWFPDYAGNNLFNSLGNIAVDPNTALLFLDFATGTTLQLSGQAFLTWDDSAPADEVHTGRGVSFTPEQVVVTHSLD